MKVSEIFSTGGGCHGGGHEHYRHYSYGGHEDHHYHRDYYYRSYHRSHDYYRHSGGSLLSISIGGGRY